jgi:predicted  nucleic acid-binding Zn-ribbon protein
VKASQRDAVQLRADAEVCLELLAPARDVLFVGEMQPDILRALDAAGYNVACVPVGSEEPANAAWPIVATLPDDPLIFPDAIGNMRFDGVLLYGLLDGITDPTTFLAQLRASMRKNGPLVGVLHRADAESLFQRAGFLIDRVVDRNRGAGSVHAGGLFKIVVRAVPRSRSAGDEAPARVVPAHNVMERLNGRLAELDREVEYLQSQLSALCDERDKIQAELQEERLINARTTDALQSSEARLSAIVEELAERGLSLDRLREQHSELLAESRFYAAALASSRSSQRDVQTQLWAARRTIAELEAQIAQGAQYVTDLLEQLAQKEAQLSGGGAYARELEAKVLQSERKLEEITAELEAVRNAAISDKLVMTEYVDLLREQVAEIPLLREAQQQLVTQTEDLISSMQKESAQIVSLIDTVQSSHFWRIKRVLNRVRARVFRR